MTGVGDGDDPEQSETGRLTRGPARPWETLGIAALMLLACFAWGGLMAALGLKFDGTLYGALAVMAPPACLVGALVVQGRL